MKLHLIHSVLRSLLPCFVASGTSYAANNFFISWASKDVHYAAHSMPQLNQCTDTTITVWRGERAGILAVTYAPQATASLALRWQITKGGKGEFTKESITPHWVSYVKTDNFQSCGHHPADLTPYDVPDVLENDTAVAFAQGEARPLWLTLDIPATTKAGSYQGLLEVVNTQTGKTFAQLSLRINVLERTLPAPHDQPFYVDFWQQPYAISRYYGVERWSEQHLAHLKPYLQLLARSGQRTVSAILFYEPWGDQSHDKFSAMVRTTKKADGTWSYDYKIFDRWVKLCTDCGLDGQISCYSMVPWDMTFRYYDEAAGKDIDLRTTTDSPEYKELWTNFLQAFAAHLKERGWYERTAIAMDERGLTNMLDAYRVAQEAVPGIKMALAGTYHPELVDKLSDYCIGYGENFSDAELAARRAKGWTSTTYTCCSTPRPNIFSNSLPAEAAWLPLYCAANHFDGYLHWSWMNWADDPLHDSRFRLFAPGDTYLVYPGPRSSVRYERFLEGIAHVCKWKTLRCEAEKEGDTEQVEQLNKLLQPFSSPHAPAASKLASLINELTRALNKQPASI